MKEAPAIHEEGRQALADALGLSFRLLRGLMALVGLAYLASGVFVVHQHERAIILLFGRAAGLGADRIRDPGLHWTWPRPFSEVVKLPTERVQTLTSSSFWYGREADFQDNAAAPPTLRPDRDGYLLTGDANLLHARWAARYTIESPEAQAFGFAAFDDLLRSELDRAVVRVTARFPVDRALRTDLEAYREAVESDLRERCRALELGIRLHGVDILGLTPPRQVAAAFDGVTQSAQERAQQISDARAYAVRTVNEAQGEAARRRSEGESARQARVADVQAQADAFEKIYPQWREHPDVVARTLLQDGVRRALTRVDQKYIVHSRSDTDNQEIRLQLGPEERIGAEDMK